MDLFCTKLFNHQPSYFANWSSSLLGMNGLKFDQNKFKDNFGSPEQTKQVSCYRDKRSSMLDKFSVDNNFRKWAFQQFECPFHPALCQQSGSLLCGSLDQDKYTEPSVDLSAALRAQLTLREYLLTHRGASRGLVSLVTCIRHFQCPHVRIF